MQLFPQFLYWEVYIHIYLYINEYTHIFKLFKSICIYTHIYNIIIIYGGSPQKTSVSNKKNVDFFSAFFSAFWPLEFGSFQLGRAPYIDIKKVKDM